MLLENWPNPIRKLLLWILGIQWAHRLLIRLSIDNPSKLILLERIFQRNRFDIQVSADDKIPNNQNTIFVSNHPHGLFDGLVLIWLGCKHGHDCRAIGRHFLSVFEPIKDWFLLVKIDSNRKTSVASSVRKQATHFLNEGGSLAITAAGRVSVSRPIWAPAQDLAWKTGAVKLSQATGSPIVLVYIDVKHSIVRQLAQRIHGVARALIQVWGFRFGRSQKLHVYVLDVIAPEQLPAGSAQEQTHWLQTRFDLLSKQRHSDPIQVQSKHS
ncbi:MAG: 1-acyl-sn-glycerol-3-phosphate acyltransferase [Pseudohongiellaceae bacterium]